MEARVLPLPTSNPVFDRGSRQIQHGRVLLARNAVQKSFIWMDKWLPPV
jgi:hypothetical protein